MFDLRLSRTTFGFMLIAVVVLLLLLLSSLSVGAAARPAVPDDPPKKKGAEPKGNADVPLDVQAKLQANDPVDPIHNEACKTYMVKLKKGKSYIIDMISADFDCYLRLEDSKGNQVAEDDDSGGELNAQILVTPEADDTFKIVATSFAGGAGNFSLKVHTISYKTAKALPLKKGELTVNGKLTDDDALDPLGPRFRHKTYTVKMSAGKTYTIDMNSGDFDTYLRLVDGQFRKLAEDDDGGGGTDSRIVFTPKTDGEYHIVATTFDGSIGDFTLTVREEK